MACPPETIDWLIAQARKTPAPTRDVLLSAKNLPPGLPKSEEGSFVAWASMPKMPFSLDANKVYDLDKLTKSILATDCLKPATAGLGAVTETYLADVTKAANFYDTAVYKENPVVIFGPKEPLPTKYGDTSPGETGASAFFAEQNKLVWLGLLGAAAAGIWYFKRKK